MKKLILLALCCLVAAGLFVVGCGDDGATDATQTTAAPTETTAAPETETTAAPETESTEGSTEAEVIKLTFASEKPPTHLDSVHMFPGFFEAVEEYTNGKYKFEIEWFPVNTILAPADVWDGLANGIVTSGESSMGYNPRAFPVIQTMMQPGISPPKDTRAMNYAGTKLLEKYQPEELSANHLFFLYACGPGWLHADYPIETVDQLKGMRIRCSGTAVRAIELVGGDPIAMPMADVYEAAQKGTIDALVSPAETLEGWKHNELFDYSTFMNQIYASDFMWVAMNNDTWNSLPDDLKAAFDAVSPEYSLVAGAMWDYGHNHALEVSEAIGHQTAELPEAEKAKLTELVKPVRDEYKAMLDGLGLPGEQIINDCVEFMEEANAREYETWEPPAE